jgi:hypothetical protein
MTSPFTMMASSLVHYQPAQSAPALRNFSADRYNGKTEALRQALVEGCFTAKDLAEMTGLSKSGLVYALLKADMRKGLIELTDGVYRRARL